MLLVASFFIKKFWYNPDSGIYIFEFDFGSKPINKLRSAIDFFEWEIIFSYGIYNAIGFLVT